MVAGINMAKRAKEKQTNEENLKNENLEKNVSFDELNALKSQLLRVSADFANFKNRVTKERSEWEEFAQINIIGVFLPMIDDLERALDAAKDKVDQDGLSWLAGFELMYKNLKKSLDQLGIKEIDCSSDFDPEFHEALMQAESDEHDSGKIVQVLNKGYSFKGKVIRHAKVSVAK